MPTTMSPATPATHARAHHPGHESIDARSTVGRWRIRTGQCRLVAQRVHARGSRSADQRALRCTLAGPTNRARPSCSVDWPAAIPREASFGGVGRDADGAPMQSPVTSPPRSRGSGYQRHGSGRMALASDDATTSVSSPSCHPPGQPHLRPAGTRAFHEPSAPSPGGQPAGEVKAAGQPRRRADRSLGDRRQQVRRRRRLLALPPPVRLTPERHTEAARYSPTSR